ncbi:ATP-dependent RNA helicase Ddx1 isoform X2 [Vanessa atalanta]|uniref:ATP-dependent RNA helicase Ddx1 isoform X2 n=1 Tax=Vanessa atalanta TaxID=42275 RepID=UPI001FCD3F50|nr:ATP-dependent RNA helicase Ddx1 isoform X2 [Vanessa atalanta]
MTAFEEFGVLSELGKAIDEMDWNLPTDVQAEAIPLILGGGDVLMAAETGSGKTGAFCLPILQIVWETLKDIQEGKTSKVISPVSTEWTMSLFDRTDALAVTPDGLRCQSRDQNGWHGCRATKGVHTKGAYYYEATVTDEGLCRVGWSTQAARLDLGTDSLGYGFGGTGKKSNAKNFEDYGKAYGKNDVIGCFLNLNNGDISYTINGEDMGVAFKLNQSRRCDCYFPAIVLKNAEMSFNFGSTPFKYPPKGDYIGISRASKDCVKQNIVSAVASTGAKQVNNAPQAIIIEPSRELAEQTCNQITLFKKYLDNPKVRELLVVGGINVKDQINQLNSGVDIVVGTPGRLEDLIQGGYLALTHCRFFVLDEADGLLKAGCGELIERLHRQIPKITSDGRRLQMVVCSATLHAFEVKKMAEKLMHFPTWVDLKGEDAVPETVHHVVVNVDPQRDRGWETQRSLVERVSHPSSAQVEALVSFLEDRPSLAKGLMKNRNAKARAIKEWEKISAILNCSCGGTIKSRQKWMKYWSDKKNAVKKKCAARNAARLGTGEGVEEVPELSEIEERILALMRGGGLGGGDEHLQLKVFDDNVNDIDVESKITINRSPLLNQPSSELTRQDYATAASHSDNASAISTPKRRTFRTVKRSPPSRRPQYSSIADKLLKLEDQRLAHEGRVVKVMEEMARTQNVLAEGVKAQAEAQKALGEGLKVLGEGLKSLAESMKIYN